MTAYTCYKCGKLYPLDDKIWKCDCGSFLDLAFKPNFNIDSLRKQKYSMWRYRDAIPLNSDDNILTFDEGYTPLSTVEFKKKEVYIKQEQLFPSGSYKDRGASVLISKVKELGIDSIIEDSSGNAGCALASYCAKGNIGCKVYVPKNTSLGKLAQISLYGAKINLISGTREDAAIAALKDAEKFYYASHCWNPFFMHGTKTFSYEISEQMGWEAPDTVVLPVGNGTLLLGCYIGFTELLEAGIIDKMPKIVAVQAANCSPLFALYICHTHSTKEIEIKDTIAEGIAIPKPVRGQQIYDVVKKTKGCFITVEENEIKKALLEVCSRGFFIEITAAVAVAGLKKYIPYSQSSEIIVSAFTGHGLKTVGSIFELIKG